MSEPAGFEGLDAILPGGDNTGMTSAEASDSPGSRSLHFPLQEGEDVVRIFRRHWIYLWPLLIAQVFAAIVPVVVVALLLDAAGALDGIVSKIFYVLAAVYIVYWLVRLALTWYRYENDIWVVTSQRLIDSYRRHPFDMKVSTADLVNVQDMTIERSGVIRTMLDFGNVVCQTASIDQDFVITGVPHPRETQALVDRERDRERERRRRGAI